MTSAVAAAKRTPLTAYTPPSKAIPKTSGTTGNAVPPYNPSSTWYNLGAPTAPVPGNYYTAAQQQGQANMNAAQFQNTASKVNQYTPLGSQTFSEIPGSGGQWRSDVTLSPAQQKLLDAQNSLSMSMAGLAQKNAGQVGTALSKPFSLKDAPPLVGADQFAAQKDKAYQDLMARQNQQFDQQDKSLQQQLANQGLTPGSEAYNRAYQPLNQARVDASNQSDLSANTLQQQLIAQANAARSQGIQENVLARNQPINELNALRSGAQVQMPSFSQYNSAPVAPAPIFNAAQAQGGANTTAYNQNVGSYNNTMNGLFGLGQAVVGSDWFGNLLTG